MSGLEATINKHEKDRINMVQALRKVRKYVLVFGHTWSHLILMSNKFVCNHKVELVTPYLFQIHCCITGYLKALHPQTNS